MKITRRQLRQIIKEEANSITEARDEGVDLIPIIFEAQDKVVEAIKILQRAKDPAITALAGVLSVIVDKSIPDVAGKGPEDFEKAKRYLVSVINSKSSKKY